MNLLRSLKKLKIESELRRNKLVKVNNVWRKPRKRNVIAPLIQTGFTWEPGRIPPSRKERKRKVRRIHRPKRRLAYSGYDLIRKEFGA